MSRLLRWLERWGAGICSTGGPDDLTDREAAAILLAFAAGIAAVFWALTRG